MKHADAAADAKQFKAMGYGADMVRKPSAKKAPRVPKPRKG